MCFALSVKAVVMSVNIARPAASSVVRRSVSRWSFAFTASDAALPCVNFEFLSSAFVWPFRSKDTKGAADVHIRPRLSVSNVETPFSVTKDGGPGPGVSDKGTTKGCEGAYAGGTIDDGSHCRKNRRYTLNNILF